MTDKEKLELIAKARELCDGKISLLSTLNSINSEKSVEHGSVSQINLNSWLTHKAEMDEHEKNRFIDPTSYGEKWICKVCGKDCPCDFILTKAKRLLGV